MFDVLLAIAISFTITFLAIPAVINVAEMKKLFDMPDERKVHHLPITPLGGLGIFAGFIFACLLTLHFSASTDFPELQYFMAASLVIFFLGLKDDILIISPVKKFIGQVLAAFIIIYYGGIQIRSMHGFLGVNQLPEMFSLLLTYFAVIVVINSFNLIDGVDGLAGSLGLLSTVIFGIYFYYVGMEPYAVIAFSLAGSLLAFLIFNFQPAKIFMGDTGSLLLGTINAILVIKFITVASDDARMPINASPAVGFTILMVPLLDTLRVFGIRILHRRSPFSPDRNHIHHLLLDRGFSHRSITLFLVAVNLAVVTAIFFCRSLNCTLLICSVIAVFFTMIAILYYMRPTPRLFVARGGTNEGAMLTKGKSSKLMTLTKDTMLEQNN